MPREPKPRHLYSVYMTSYATLEIKQRVERRELYIHDPVQLTSESFYFGMNERTAGVKFYQACKAAAKNPLASSVSVMRDNETILRVSVEKARA